MQKAERRLQAILQKYKNIENYSQLDVSAKIFRNRVQNLIAGYKKSKRSTLLLITISTLLILSLTKVSFLEGSSGDCLLEMPSDASKWFREPETCAICQGVAKIQKVSNVTPSDFYRGFVEPAEPVVVADGALTWPALKSFNFDFFRNLYKESKPTKNHKTCQFFPYKTEFTSLEEALEMPAERAHFGENQKPWYIGWSNCNDEAGKILRTYYRTPYFLPNVSENMALNWIFMGGPGFGAHMHVDNVQYPSWQAQIRGRKKWRLAPPPECFYKCKETEVTVEPGEIIVVDTNRWYHQTFVLPGEISITIGSEFD